MVDKAKPKEDLTKTAAPGSGQSGASSDPTNPAGGQFDSSAYYDPAGQPLGVPRGYTAPNPRLKTFIGPSLNYEPQPVKPQYYPGSEWTIAQGLGPDDMAQLQYALKSLGLIGAKTPITLGVWDDTSANAFKQVLVNANAGGSDWGSTLDEMENTAATMPQAAAPLKDTANPLDVQALGRAAGRQYLGQGLDEGQQATFNADYRAQESQTLSTDSGTADPSGAGWGEWARTEARSIDPLKFDARKVVDNFDVLAKMIRGEQVQ